MQEVSYGYCRCGCGEKTSIAKWTAPRDHMVKGEPRMFRAGHQRRNTFGYTVDAETGCWIWHGHFNTGGYGQFSCGPIKNVLAHRYYFEQARGPIPEGTELHHLCTNRRCVNPDHLQTLTRKQHHPTYSKPAPFLCWKTTLTASDIAEIRALRGKVTQEQLGKRFGVYQTTISRVQLGKGPKVTKDECTAKTDRLRGLG
jgi:hypothetical protein